MDYSTIQASDVTHTPEKPKNNLFDAFSAALNTYIGISSAKNSKDKEVAKEAERKKFEQEDRQMKRDANQSTMDYNKARMDSLYGKQKQIDSVVGLNEAKTEKAIAEAGVIDEKTQQDRDKLDSDIELTQNKIAQLTKDGSNKEQLLELKKQEIKLKQDKLAMDTLLSVAKSPNLTGKSSTTAVADEAKSAKIMADTLQDIYNYDAKAKEIGQMTGKFDIKALRSSKEYEPVIARFNISAESNGFPVFGDPSWEKYSKGLITLEGLKEAAKNNKRPALGGSTEQTTSPANPAEPTPPQIPATVKERVEMHVEQRKAKAQQSLTEENIDPKSPQLPTPPATNLPTPPAPAQTPNLPSQQIEQPLDKLKVDPAKEFTNTQSNPYQGLYGKDKASNEPRPQENLVPTLRGSSDVKSRTGELFDKVGGVVKEGAKKAADLFAFVVDDQTARSTQIFNAAKATGVGSDDDIQKGMKEGQKIRAYEAPHLKESIEKAMENMNNEENKKFLAQIVKNGGKVRVGKSNVKVLSDVELKALQNYLQF